MSDASKVSLLDDRRKATGDTNGNGPTNGGGILAYRVGEIERRLDSLEAKVDSINSTVIEINTTLKSLATKTYVLTIFGVTGGVAVVTLIAHLLIRVLPS